MTLMRTASACATAVLLFSCGEGGGAEPITVAWSFADGGCASNGVQTVRLTYQQEGGTPSEPFDFACDAGSGSIGVLEEGSYGIRAQGLAAGDKVVAENFGTTINFGPRGIFGTVDVTLHPKAADLKVTWTVQGSGSCPPNVQIPFFIALYNPPASGTALTDKVTEAQETCASGEVTLTNVAPGSYVVEVDTRAVTPDRSGTAPVTVEPGTDAEVAVVLQ